MLNETLDSETIHQQNKALDSETIHQQNKTLDSETIHQQNKTLDSETIHHQNKTLDSEAIIFINKYFQTFPHNIEWVFYFLEKFLLFNKINTASKKVLNIYWFFIQKNVDQDLLEYVFIGVLLSTEMSLYVFNTLLTEFAMHC